LTRVEREDPSSELLTQMAAHQFTLGNSYTI